MPSRSSSAETLVSLVSCADQHPGHISSLANREKEQVGKQETRASEKGDEREEQGDRTESIPPSRPKRREDEKAEKIEVELSGPPQLRHVSEKDRQQSEPVAGNDDSGIGGQRQPKDDQKSTKRPHRRQSATRMLRLQSRL